MKIHIIPVRPHPKETARKGKNGNMYTPTKTRQYEAYVGLCANKWFKRPMMGKVKLFSRFYFTSDDGRGDLSNLVKSLEDGMNGIAYIDDKQIAAHDNAIVIVECKCGEECECTCERTEFGLESYKG